MSVTEQDVRAAAPANAPEDVIKWAAEIAELTTPDRVEFADGSQEEWDRLTSAHQAQRREAPQLLPCSLEALRCCAC